MAYAVGKQDGSQKFGFTSGTFGSESFIVESYTETTPSNRVDLDDGNGKPIGSSIVPGRKEVSLTVQFGASGNSSLAIGDTVTYDSNEIGITAVEVQESQSDYVRMTLSGFVLTGSGLTTLSDIS